MKTKIELDLPDGDMCDDCIFLNRISDCNYTCKLLNCELNFYDWIIKDEECPTFKKEQG